MKNLYFVLFGILCFSSCRISERAQRERVYLQGIDTSLYSVVEFPEPLIQKGDLLTIMVYSDNMEATRIYNQQQNGGGSGGGGNMASSEALTNTGRGYQVDLNGDIYFHSIGNINVDGLTRQQIADIIQKHFVKSNELQNPYVTVRYTNKRITVLGEVNNPGLLMLPDQKVSILDALSLSGDLTTFGRRDNVLIVREEGKERRSERLNITSPDIYKSPYFYLKQNDLVYIEPNRRKSAGNEQLFVRNVSILTSLVSVVSVTIALLSR